MTAPTIVQSKSNEGTSPANTQVKGISTALTTAPTAANALLAFYTVSDFAGIHTDMSARDTLLNSFTRLDQANTNAAGGAASLCSLLSVNIAGGTDTVTTELSTNGDVEDFQAAFILEIGNVATSPLVGNSGNTQNVLANGTNNLVSGNITVSSAQVPCILIGIAFNTSTASTPTVGTGMTFLVNCWAFQTSPSLSCVAYRNITTAGTYQAIFNQTNASASDCAVVAVALLGSGAVAPTIYPIPMSGMRQVFVNDQYHQF